MFRSRKTKRDGDKTNENVPVAKLKRKSASELAAMIQKVQLSADVVEKDILDTEEKLNFDIENARNNKDFQYKQRNSDNLADAEKYLQELFIDVDHVKKMKHPQSEMIKKDVHQLHDRWDKLCTEYRRVYEQVYVPELRPKVDWLKLVEEKQYSVNRKGFGNDLVTVEKQLAEHNIIHKEIEAYHPHIRELEASPEYANRLKDAYGELLSTSGHRQEDLTTLHVFMQSSTQQLMWLDMEQEERKQMDWSDRNTDYESRSRKYEDIVNKDIVEKEMAVNSIQDEGDRLLKSNHPAKATIMAHMDALDSDWKKYLNLLICEEAHLRFMTDYHKFRKDVNEVKDQIDKKNKEVDRRYRVDSKDSAFRIESLLYDIQEKQKETDSLGETVQALQARSHQIVPLKFRHEKVQKPLPVEALCDFEEDEMTVQRGDKVMLKDNMDPVTWLVADSSGMTKPIPSTCLVIPPTDSESISLADGLTDQYSNLRHKLSHTDGIFRQRLSEVQQSAPSAETDGSDEKECVQYISDLEKVYSNMDDLERKMLFNLKTPLDKSKPADDAKDRVKQHQEFAKQLKTLQSDKNKAKHAAENFLKRTPKCSSSSKLNSKINENEEKYINVSRLTVDYGEKIKSANSLESSLKKTNEMLLPNEQALTQEFTLPGDVSGIRARRQELKTIKSDLRKTQQMTDEAANNLRNTKQQCMTISTQYNEQCPDISRQESQLHRLQNRQSESLQETEERLNRLEESEKLLSNYNTSYNSLDMWLNKLPKHELTDHETPESLQKKVEDQTKLVDEIRSKEKEETAMENLGHEYLSLMQDYEKSADRYRYTVEQEVPISRATISQEQHLPGEKLQEKERNMIKKYTEASAANEQHLVLLKNMQNYQKPEKEKKAQQIQVKSQWSEKDGQSDLQKLYGEEMDKRKSLEGQLSSLQKTTREEHETLMVRERKIKELELKLNQTTNKENTLLKKRINAQEETKPKMEIQNVTQTAVKSDLGMLKETELLKTRLSDLQNENSDMKKKAEKERKETENKMHLMQKKIHEFEQQQPKLDEKVIIKEVAKTEKDPATEEELNNLRKMLEDEKKNNKAMNDEINHMQKKYITLEQSKQKLLREEVVTPDRDVEKVVANLKKQISELQQKLGDKEKEIDRVQKEMFEYKKQAGEERSSKEVVERNFTILQKKVHEIEQQPPKLEENVIIKEVAKVEKDPQMVVDLQNLTKLLEDEKKKNKAVNEEINQVQKKYVTLEKSTPKEVTKEVVKPDLEVEKLAAKLKKQVAENEKEIDRLQKEMFEFKKQTGVERSSKEAVERNFTILQKKVHEIEQQPPKLEENVIIKEVAKVEKDPQMLEDLQNLTKLLEDEKKKNKAVNEEMNQVQKKYVTLEKSTPKEVTKEVVKPDLEVEKLAAKLKKQVAENEKEIDRLQKEMFEFKKQTGVERSSKEAVERNFTILQKKVHEIEQQPPKLEENVIIKEVAKVEKDPQMLEDLQNLTKLLEDEKKKNKAVNQEMNQVQKKYVTLEKSTPKEVTKEVVKPDLEVEKLAAKLKKQVAENEKEIDRLQKEMFEFKKQTGVERSSKEAVERNFTILQKKVHEIEQQPPKLEENVIIKEVAKVEKDPQMLEDLQNLTKLLEDEKKKNKAVNEEMNQVQKKYVTLEKSTPKEVTKEVVKPDLEVEKLAAKLKKQVAENEKEIDRLQKEMFEFKKQTGVERSSKETVERNFTILQKKVHEIEQQPPKLEENVIIKEVAKVEKDPQMLEDLQNLTKLLEDEKRKNKAVNEEMNQVQKKYLILEKSTPREVVKPDLEVERLAEKLKKQVAENEKEIDRLQKEMLEYKKQTGEEKSSKEAVERNFTILQKKVHEIEQQPPKLEENVIIKEVAKVEKDPQMVVDLQNLTKLLEDEKKKNKAVNEEMNQVQKKYVTLEKSTPKEVIKEVVKPDLEVERSAANLKKQVADKEKDIDRLQKEMFEYKKQAGEERSSKEAVERNFTILQKKVHEIEQQPPKLEENVIIKEVAKVEKDPQMVVDLQNLTKLLEDEKKKNKAVNEEMNQVQKKYLTLEKSPPKEVVKPDLEVERLATKLKKQVAENEKEIDKLQKEMFEFKKQAGEERSSKEAVERNFTILQKKVHEIEQQPPKLVENVIIKEVAKVEKDPQMVEGLQNLSKLLEDEKKKNTAVNEEMNQVQKKYLTLEKSPPKEVIREVVKPDLEVERLSEKLKKQVADKEKEIDRLQKELFESKKQTGEERSSKEAVERNFTILQKKVHEIEQQPPKLVENVIIKEVAKVEKDPQMVEGLQNLTKLLEDEKKKNKAVNEEMNQVQKKYLTLEKSPPKEVIREVVKPDLEVERLSEKLKKQVADKEKEIDRLQKEMFESKKQTGEERSSKEAVERNFTILQKKVHEIEQQPPKLVENVIIKEVAKVEKDPQMVEGLQNLTKLLEDEKKKNKAVNEEMNQVQKKYLTLEKSPPKEVIREVVKPDLEVERMAEKLKKQVADKEKEIDRLQKEMFEYKKQAGEERSSKEAVERNFTILQKKVHEIEQQPPKLEENVIIKEVAKVEKDPQMVEGLQILTKLLEDEKKKNKAVNEEMNQVQKKYLTLEKSPPKEVIREVVKPDLEVERLAEKLKKEVADKEKEIDRLQKEMFEYKKQTGEERSSKEAVERNFTILQKKVHEIEQQPPKLVENVIIKEVAKVEKDPQMVEDLQNLSKFLEDEKKKNKAVNEEMNQVQKKYLTLEKSTPKEVIKEVVKPDLEVERFAEKLKKQVADKEKEIDRLQKEMFESKKQTGEERSSKEAVERNFTILQKKVHEIEQQPPKLEENVIIKEVAKVEKDPQMVEGLQNLTKLLEDEKKKNKAVNEEMNQVQKKYLTLEKSPPKEVIREVVKPDLEVERMAAKLKKQVADNEKEIDRLQKEMFEYKKQAGEERSSKEAVVRDFTILQKKVHEIEQLPPKLEENVIIKEVAKVEKDPQMVEGLQNLTKLLEDEKKKNKAVNEEMNQVQKKYVTLEKSTPKEVIREVVKPDLEVERMAEKLKKQVAAKEKEIDRLQKEMFEYKKQAGEERSSKEAVERNFTILQKKVHEIEQQPPKLEENVIIKEVAKVEKDPQMVEGLQNLTKLLEDEKKKNKTVNEEMNQVQKKYLTLEKSPPKEVIREVVKPDLEVERMAEKLKKQVAANEKEIDRLQKEMFEYKKQAGEERSSKEAVERNFTILQKKVHEMEQQPPKLEENVIIKEVAKVEKDPQMVEGLQNLTKLLEDEKKKNKAVNEEMNQVQKKYLILEKSPPKEVIREVVKPDLEVERMAAKLKKQVADNEKEMDRLQKEMFEYKKQAGEERSSKEAVERNFTILQKKVHEIEQQPPKLEENVIIKEVAKVEKDPQMVEGLQNLTKLLEDEKKKNKAVNEEMNQVQKKYLILEKSPPKEVIREVVKPDLEVERMAAKLKKQVADNEKEMDRLQKEMFEYKKQAGEERSSKEAVERNFTVLQKKVHEIEQQPPKLEENVIIKEVAKVEKDPQMVEGLQNLTKLLEDEKKKNEAVNEEMNRVQKKYVTLEKSTPKEVIKEVVKADPNTERKALSLEKQLNNEQKRLQEAEINLSITREEILRLRNRPPEVKFQDVVKVERDPQQDHEISELKYQVQEEKDICIRLEREVTFLKEKLLIIENAAPKVEVKEVLQEVVKPDPKTEQRAANLSKQLEEEKCLGENLKTKINNLQLEIVKLQNKQPEVHIQEVIKLEENPQTLEELSHLKELLDDEMKKSSYVKRQLLNLQSNYDTLATEKAKVEVKEVVHEVIRPDPETEKVTSNLRLELQRLKRDADGRNMEIENLKEQIIALQNKPPEIQTKETIKEIIKYERSVVDEEELSNIRDDLDKESKKRMDAEFQITKLEGKIFNLENRQPEIQEKVVVQKSVEYKTDPALEDKVNSCQRALEQEQKLHHLAEENLQDTRERVSDQLTEIKLLNEQLKNKYEIEHELKQLKLQITILEKQKKEAENNVQIKEVVKLEKDPTVVKEANNLRYELENEQKLRNNVENDNQNLMAQVRELKMQGEKEKIVYQEVVKIERDEAVDQELSKFKTLYDEETQLSRSKQVEIDRLAMLLSKLTKDMEELKLRVSDNELFISSKDMELVQLLRKLNDLESKQEEEKMEEMRKTSHISKRVTVVDPDTGKKLSPYEAYKAHLIDWDTYKHLQNQEKEWELLTITGPKGQRIILRDHNSGQEYPIDEAIKQGFISENDFQKYEGGELSITDIAAKIAGPAEDIVDRFQRGEKIEDHELFYAIAVSMLSEGHPIAGVYDMTNETKLSVQSAVQKSLIDTQTSQRLLEAQAATGGIIDINTAEKCSVHQALERGLVVSSDIQKLISAQKAFTGIEDAVTRERLSVGEALKRGWLYEDAAYRYLEAQHVTGGLVNPSKSGRVPVHEAKEKGIISSAVESYLNNETSYIKDITDPSTKEQITYKQALDNCFMDESTGFPLLKANAEVKPLIDF